MDTITVTATNGGGGASYDFNGLNVSGNPDYGFLSNYGNYAETDWQAVADAYEAAKEAKENGEETDTDVELPEGIESITVTETETTIKIDLSAVNLAGLAAAMAAGAAGGYLGGPLATLAGVLIGALVYLGDKVEIEAVETPVEPSINDADADAPVELTPEQEAAIATYAGGYYSYP